MVPVGLAVAVVVLAAATAVGTTLARAYALRRQLVDAPGERRSHRVATPRGGGIAIALVLGLALLAVAVCSPSARSMVSLVASALVLVSGIGWVDDHRPLSPLARLAVHAVAAGLLGAAAVDSGLPVGWAVVVSAATLVLVNAWNFMDGIDGIATSQAILFGLCCAALAGAGSRSGAAGLALAAACAGFLPFNFPRACIFLGDVGSGALGLLVAAMAAVALSDGVPAPLLLLPLSAFLVDTALTLARRMLRGERWWTPHVQHAYQCAARRWGHVRVTVGYGLWTVVAGLLAIAMSGAGASTAFMMGAVVTWHLLGGGVWWWLAHARGRTTERGRIPG